MNRLAILALACAATVAAQAPPESQQRDLKVEKIAPSKPATPELTPAKTAAIPRSYALVIGISAYQNLGAAQQLHFAERDADSIYSILISPDGGNFRAENVHKLSGSKATLANLRRELEQWLPGVAKDDDRVLIYFAGHGFVFGGSGYLAPYDFDVQHPETTGYPMESLGRVFGSAIKGRWKVLLTDSCHSGAITPETKPELVNGKLLSLDPSLFSLTASRDREQSLESPDLGGGHGVFTYYVVKGMEGAADENGDGIVNADELAEYVHRNVREYTQGRQNPTSERGSFDPNMLLAYNPGGIAPGAPPAPKFGTLIFESNMDGVELFVDNNSAGLLKKGEPFRMPGLQPGLHQIKAVKMGYEPDGPREEMVYPGQESTVRVRILIPRRRDKAATDAVDKGIEYYTRGGEPNYRKAEQEFDKALSIDSSYSQAALYLGRTQNALFEEEKAEAAFKRAIEIDPDYTEARSSYAGMLFDLGNFDEAIRQLNVVLQREPNNTTALYLLAGAYLRKEAYPQSIESARKAISLNPNNAEVHFYLAEALRMNRQFGDSIPEYREYLRLSNFDTKLAGKFNYYVAGYLFGVGRKKRASQQDIWRDLRSEAYFGLCDSSRKLKQFDEAISDCRNALSYTPDDALTHYAIALAYAQKANAENSTEAAAAAEEHFRRMISINPDLAESANARKMLTSIEAELAKR
jgi:tetratricopeptide (TPR) repeat protein